jgi:hypothetical protein
VALRPAARSATTRPCLDRAAAPHEGPWCSACGSRHDLTLDHIIPLSLGGRSTRSNVQVLCRACNSSKGRGAGVGRGNKRARPLASFPRNTLAVESRPRFSRSALTLSPNLSGDDSDGAPRADSAASTKLIGYSPMVEPSPGCRRSVGRSGARGSSCTHPPPFRVTEPDLLSPSLYSFLRLCLRRIGYASSTDPRRLH